MGLTAWTRRFSARQHRLPHKAMFACWRLRTGTETHHVIPGLRSECPGVGFWLLSGGLVNCFRILRETCGFLELIEHLVESDPFLLLGFGPTRKV